MGRSRDINVIGTVTSITYPAYGGSTYLDVIVSLHDSEIGENLLLRFLGRRTLSCLEIGSSVRVSGALSHTAGAPVVFNPEITVIPGD